MSGDIGRIAMYHLRHYTSRIAVSVRPPSPHELKRLAEGFAAHTALELTPIDA